MSKWIGETEKNLAAVFDAAERAQAVLFFDEADALFGGAPRSATRTTAMPTWRPRTCWSGSTRFDGLAVLATNLRGDIDPAFVRRLEFVVDFGEPEATERLRLWEGHLPADVPRSTDVELAELADLYPLTGGVIRNAALAAAFLAAADGGRVGQEHLVLAIRREYDKAGRSFPGAPFGILEEEPWQPLPT